MKHPVGIIKVKLTIHKPSQTTHKNFRGVTMKRFLAIPLALIALTALLSITTMAAPRFAVISGNWNGPIWAATAGGPPGSGTPTSSDDVTINAGVTVTVNVAANAASLTVNGTLNVNAGFNLTIANTGTVTANSGGALVFSATSVINGGGGGNNGILVVINSGATLTTANASGFSTTTFTGSISINNGNKAAPSYSTSANYIYNATADQVLGNGITGANNLTLAGSGKKSLSANTTVSGKLSRQGTASLDNGGFTLSYGASATLEYKGTVSVITGTEFPNNFAGTGGVIIDQGNSNVVTLDATKTALAGDLNIQSGVLDLSSFTANRFTPGGTLTVANGARLKIGDVNTFPQNYTTITLGTTSTVEYSGTNQLVNNYAYGNLTLSGSQTKTMPGAALTIAGDFTMSGTAAATAANPITAGGNFTLGSGTTFNASSFTHNVGGNWSNSGTFNANSGTIILNGTGAQSIGGSAVSSFNNLIIANTTAPVTATVNFNVAGTLTVNAGAILAPAAAVVVNNSGAAGTITGSGTVRVTRTAAVPNYAGQYKFLTNTLASMTIEYAGSGGSQLADLGTYWGLKINNASGVNLSAPTAVNSTLTLTQGELQALSPNTITINAANTAAGAVVIPNLAGSIRGTITRTIDAGNDSSEFKFTSFHTYIIPVSLQSGNRTVTFTVHPNEWPSPIANQAAAIKRWYQIDLTGGNFTAGRLHLAYDNGTENVNIPPVPTDFTAVFRLRPGSTSWENYGAVDGNEFRAAAFLVSDWSTKFAIGDGTQALPVQLASFTGAVVNNGDVRLDWRTITEINNYGFYVQRRNFGTTEWTEIAGSFVPGAGTTNEPRNYTYTDVTGISGPTQYRLKQVDLDGTQHFTEPILVDSPTSVPEVAPRVFALSQNYPNPFNPSTEIKFTVEVTGRATLDVYNALGQKVATLFDGIAEAGQFNRIQFNASGLASGVYFYRLVSGEKSDLKKLMLLK